MATFSPRLQLKRNDGSDPFLRQDFVDNWNKIDDAPGVYPCTSTSRPNWGAAQAGRRIIETNTRAEYLWTGSAWQPILGAPSAWLFGASPGTWLSANSGSLYTLGTLTTSRPGSLLIEADMVVGSIDVAPQVVTGTIYLNGAVVTNAVSGFKQWTGANNNSSYNVYDTMNAKAMKAVGAGTHTVGIRIAVSDLSTAAVRAYRLGASVTLINETDR